MLKIFYKSIKDKKIEEIKNLRVGCWINVVDPTEDEIKFLIQNAKIDPEIVKDILDEEELPRIEKGKEASYIILNVPYKKNTRALPYPFIIAIYKDFFITISKQSLPIIDSFLVEEPVTTQKVKNLLQISLETTRSYEEEIRKIDKTIDIYIKKVRHIMLKSEDIIYFVQLEEVLNEYITSLILITGIYEKLLTRKYFLIFEEDKDLTEDLIIDSRQSLNMCQGTLRKISSLREAYSAIIGNSMSKAVKFLTSLTVIVAIPTIIASLFGMNIALPLQDSSFAFAFVLFSILVFVLIAFLFFRVRDWF